MTLKEKLKAVTSWETELAKLQMQMGFIDDGAPIRAEVRDASRSASLSAIEGAKFATVEVDEDKLRALLRTSLESQIDALQRRLDGVVMTIPA